MCTQGTRGGPVYTKACINALQHTMSGDSFIHVTNENAILLDNISINFGMWVGKKMSKKYNHH